MSHSEEDQWISTSDMMSGLMLIFLFIAVLFMVMAEEQHQAVVNQNNIIKQITIDYTNSREELYNNLLTEFKDDLPIWDAEITPDLVIRFKEPTVLFDTGQSTLKPRFATILSDFFPRYIKVLTNPIFIGAIREVRIEGHTSSEWNETSNHLQSYIKNMELSQDRTRAVLFFILKLDLTAQRSWVIDNVSANGLSSSKPITINGIESADASRRVEFRVLTNADQKIQEILNEQLD